MSFGTSSNLLKRLKKIISPQTIQMGSSPHLAAQALIRPSLPGQVRKECEHAGARATEILEGDDGPHRAQDVEGGVRGESVVGDQPSAVSMAQRAFQPRARGCWKPIQATEAQRSLPGSASPQGHSSQGQHVSWNIKDSRTDLGTTILGEPSQREMHTAGHLLCEKPANT